MENISSKSSNCPVCNKEIILSEIESHVDRCLFLNSEIKASCSVKRNSVDVKICKEESSRPTKRLKAILENKQEEDKYYSFSKVDIKSSQDSQKPSMSSKISATPLAEEMRPTSLDDYIGQTHVLGENKILRSLLQQNDIPSMILWGPPGCGKTSLAHVISKQCQIGKYIQYRFVKLSATMAGVNDVKEAIKIAKNEMSNFKRKTILFMDEIHRFNKLQQDIFLSHVENGCITPIGATTENPSFSLNSALLSRCRVIVLQKLSTPNLLQILYNAIQQTEGFVVKLGENMIVDKTNTRFEIDEDTVLWLAEMSDGDARIALNSLQMAIKLKTDTMSPQITLDDIKDGIKRSHLLYDRKGDQHYDIISALHKSIRGSDDSAALYWLARMLEGGEDPLFIARRLVVCASEDIGMQDSSALPMAVSAMQACKMIGMPECGLFLAHVATYLARAPKSREVYDALSNAKRYVTEHKGSLPDVPLHLRNAPTKLMKNLGYGAGYKMADTVVGERTYMPEGMEKINFFGI